MAEIGYRRVPSLFVTSIILVLVGLFLFVALLNSQQELAILCLLVLGMAGGMKLWAHLSASRIRCRPLLSTERVFAGETLGLMVDVENGKFLPVWLEVSVPVQGSSRSLSSDTALTDETDLFWFQATRFHWALKAGRRGVHELGPVRAATGDLFGFYLKEQEMGDRLQVVVYPRLIPIGPFALPRRDFFGIPGSESPVDDPVYILGTTDYHHGRPAKYIHWKASARHNRLQEKVFEPTQQEKVLLVVDVDRFAEHRAEEAFERALEVVASLAVRLDRQGCSVGFLTNGDMAQGASPIVSITKNPQQLHNILEALARLAMTPKETLPHLLRRFMNIPWGTSCIYFTFEEDESTRIAREHLRRRKIPVVFVTDDLLPGLRQEDSAPGPSHEVSFEEVRTV
jgi:uncharacterized protein (DUF58 family)